MAPNKNAGKAAAKAAKKTKQADKAAKKEAQAIKTVIGGKGKGAKGKGKAGDAAADEEDDLEAILERYQAEMQANLVPTMTTLESPPPPRSNALLIPSPSTISSEPAQNHLYLLFGEFFDGSRATFYNSVVRYDIAKDEWREYKSGNMPAPRSSAAYVAGPNLGDGGGIIIFGGEYASPTQSSFHHYKDMWVFSIKTHNWEKMDFKRGPSGRSGHRMVLWKHYIILFGGFIDVGIKTNYLSDLWVFDLDIFRWKQIENLDPDRCPSARSGFSFIPCPEGAILHGGYRKDYVKGTKPKGVPLDDTWLLRMDTDLGKLKWERRKRAGYMPSLRSGCTMTPWANKGMGVLFGGVLDEERDEEDMESTFYNDLFAYNPAGNGRWVSLNLKKRKKAGGKRRKKVERVRHDDEGDEMEEGESQGRGQGDGDEDEGGEDGMDVDEEGGDGEDDRPARAAEHRAPVSEGREAPPEDDDDDADDPAKSIPLTRYNAMLAIVKNTLFIYGGIFETSSPAREYTLDDFVTLNLEKLDRYHHIRGTGLDELALEWQGSSDEGESDSEDDGRESDGEGNDDEDEGDDADVDMELEFGDEDESEEARAKRHAALSAAEQAALRQSATKFLGVSRDTTRSQQEVDSTPLPGEKIRAFYERSKAHWAGVAHYKTGSRGKMMRREGFELARAKYEEYRPILDEIERIQREAELDAAAAAAASKRAGPGMGEVGRNRR